MEPNQGLGDPCEHEDVDSTSYLTSQQREDITRSAQLYLRMMHFRQIHVVLGMPQEEEGDRAAAKAQPVSKDQPGKNGVAVKTENGASTASA